METNSHRKILIPKRLHMQEQQLIVQKCRTTDTYEI